MCYLLQFLPSSDISMICVFSVSLGYVWHLCAQLFSQLVVYFVNFRNKGIVDDVLHELYRVEIFVFILENMFVASCQRNKNFDKGGDKTMNLG